MSLTTYAQLQTAVTNWLHRDDLASIVPDLITIGEKRIFRTVRTREMETALTGTIASGVIPIPADYLAIKFAYLAMTPVALLKKSSASQIYADYPLRASSGTPVSIAREGSNFIFGPYPSTTETIGGIYYAKPTSIDTSANALFLANPDLYLFAALCEATPYLKDDPRIVVWEAKLANIMTDIKKQEADESAAGGGLTVRSA